MRCAEDEAGDRRKERTGSGQTESADPERWGF